MTAWTPGTLYCPVDAPKPAWGGEVLPKATPTLKGSLSRTRHPNRYSGEEGEYVGDIKVSQYALLLFRVKTFAAHGVVTDIIRATWIPTLVGLVFNIALYVVVYVEPKDAEVNNFLQNELFSDYILTFVGTIVSFLVVFQTDAQQKTNKELSLHHCEACANTQAIALLVTTLARARVTEANKLRRFEETGVIFRKTTVEVGVSVAMRAAVKSRFFDVVEGPNGYVYGKIEVAELALLLASVSYDLKWTFRDGGKRYNAKRLPLYASKELAARFEKQFYQSRPALSGCEALLVLIGEELLTIDGLSSDLQLYLMRLIQRILHLRQLIHALSLYQPPAAIGFIFWVVFLVFYAFSCVRDLMATGWTAVGVNLVYVVGFVGAWRVARDYSNPYTVGEARTGQLSYVSLETALAETSIYALFNLPPEVTQPSIQAAMRTTDRGYVNRWQAALDLLRSQTMQQKTVRRL